MLENRKDKIGLIYEGLSERSVVLGSSEEHKVFSYDGYSYLSESGLSKIKQHSENGFFTMSASRHEFTADENRENTNKLKAMIRSAGLGFISLIGGYMEGDTKVVENSLFVPYMADVMSEDEFLSFAVRVGLAFEQEGFLFKVPSSDSVLLYERPNNSGNTYSKVIKLGKFKVNDIKDKLETGFSQLRKGSSQSNIKYIFDGYKVPSNSIGARCMSEEGEILK